MKKIAVIGAGIAGLACAYVLQEAGCDVTVFEREANTGGRMRSRTKDGLVWDIGADHLCNLYDRIKFYCGEFGIAWEPMRFLQYGLVKNGNVVIPSEAIGRVSKLRLAFEYFRTKAIGTFFNLDTFAEFDNDNAYDVMKRRCGKDVADYFVDAFTSTYQFHRAKETSVGALMGIMQSIKMDKERWNLCRTQGGMQALPDAFAKRLNVKFDVTIDHVAGSADGRPTVTIDGKEEAFDVVVLATPAPATLKLLKNPTDRQRDVLARSRYATTIGVAFRVDKNCLPNIAVTWVPYVESKKISGFVNETMKGEELMCADGTTLISTWLHEEFAKEILDKSDEEIFALVKEEFVRICPWVSTESELGNHDLQQWPHAMPVFAQGHLAMVKEFMTDGQGANNVFFTGDYLNSPWTEGALRNGERVAASIISRA